jgi:uncharacterized protein YegL
MYSISVDCPHSPNGYGKIATNSKQNTSYVTGLVLSVGKEFKPFMEPTTFNPSDDPSEYSGDAADDRPKTGIRNRPGGAIASRPLHFIWLCDCSNSMNVAGKIQSLNTAIKEAIPVLQQTAAENPNVQLLIRAIRFSDGAQWHVQQATAVDDFRWVDLTASGITDMGKALELVAGELAIPPMPDRALPPVLVLITDGFPTDDFSGGLKTLMAQPWGQKAVRVGIAIGQDANHEILQKFIDNPELRVMQANNPEELADRIKWASTVPIRSVSQPRRPGTTHSKEPGSSSSANVVMIQPIEQADQGIEMW